MSILCLFIYSASLCLVDTNSPSPQWPCSYVSIHDSARVHLFPGSSQYARLADWPVVRDAEYQCGNQCRCCHYPACKILLGVLCRQDCSGLSLHCFICFEYRKLNEDIDINIQQGIEQVFERKFDREVEYERDQVQRNNTYIVKSAN